MLGRHHPHLRRIRALRRDAARRRESGILLAEGLHLGAEALATDAPVELALHSARLVEQPEGVALLQRMRERGWDCAEVAPDVLDGLQDARSPQPVLLLVRWTPADVAAALAPPMTGDPLVLVAHGLQDPGNLGTLLRTADAAGATGVLVTGDGADPRHPRTVRASMGAIFRLRLACCSLDAALAALGARGLRLVAADPRDGRDYDACNLRGALALFLGSEAAGLPPALHGAAEPIRIPMRPGVESLSVAAAGAVLLFAAARQRGRPAPDHSSGR